jgi:hypothetical protein
MSFNNNAYRKIWIIFAVFTISLQIIGTVSSLANQKRLKQFDPWQPSYSNAQAPLLARWDSGWYISLLNMDIHLRLMRHLT